MKNLNYFTQKGLTTEQERFDFLISTLKDSIFTWEYFSDFDKSLKNATTIKAELQLLNPLLVADDSEIDSLFISILRGNPKIRKILPILIALRNSKLASTPIIDNLATLEATNKSNLFDPKSPFTTELETQLLNFFSLSGLRSFFLTSHITSLFDYVVGIEVGMDTNARKNRTGETMEHLVEHLVENFCKIHNFKCMSQATKTKLLSEWNISIEVDKIDRRFDVALLDSNNQLYLFEVNYYSGGGSKLKATAGEYKEVYNMLSKQNIPFIWVTDGLGWLTAKTALSETCLHNDYIVNLHILSEGILDEIIL